MEVDFYSHQVAGVTIGPESCKCWIKFGFFSSHASIVFWSRFINSSWISCSVSFQLSPVRGISSSVHEVNCSITSQVWRWLDRARTAPSVSFLKRSWNSHSREHSCLSALWRRSEFEAETVLRSVDGQRKSMTIFMWLAIPEMAHSSHLRDESMQISSSFFTTNIYWIDSLSFHVGETLKHKLVG